jgi:DNA-binding transcriptional LysR family regulator
MTFVYFNQSGNLIRMKQSWESAQPASVEGQDNMLELHELQVFLVAAETENFSETGRILQISQPAVSGHIQALEQRLNTRLFDRIGRNIKLNETGETFVPIVRNLLKEAQRVEDFMASRRGTIVGEFTIGCSATASRYFLPSIMARFLERHPGVRMACQGGPRGQSLDRLSMGEIDLAVTSLRVPRREIEYCHLADDQLILIAPPDHPWASAGSIRPQELVDYPLVLRESSSGTLITLNRELAAYDMSVEMLQSHLILWSTESIVQSVIAGIAPAFVSRRPAEMAIQQEAAVEVAIQGLRLVQHLYMARHTGFHATEAQTAFWEFVFAPENEDLRQILT